MLGKNNDRGVGSFKFLSFGFALPLLVEALGGEIRFVNGGEGGRALYERGRERMCR